MIGDIPAQTDEFDFVWCRDMLSVVSDLSRRLVECTRVLKSRQFMLVLLSYITKDLDPGRADRLREGLGLASASTDRSAVEARFAEAGLTVDRHEIIGTEWLEWREEGPDTERPSRDLLRTARLRRDMDRFVAVYGEDACSVVLSSCQWGIYSMLGMLEPNLYVHRNTY